MQSSLLDFRDTAFFMLCYKDCLDGFLYTLFVYACDVLQLGHGAVLHKTVGQTKTYYTWTMAMVGHPLKHRRA